MKKCGTPFLGFRNWPFFALTTAGKGRPTNKFKASKGSVRTRGVGQSICLVDVAHDSVVGPPADCCTDCDQAAGIEDVNNRPKALFQLGKRWAHPKNR